MPLGGYRQNQTQRMPVVYAGLHSAESCGRLHGQHGGHMQSLGKNGCGLSILTARNTDYTLMFLGSTVAIIIAVAVVGILLLRKRAQTWRCLEGAEKALDR